MLKGKIVKGKKMILPCYRESRRPRRWSIPCMRKGPRILALDRTSNAKGTSHLLCQMAPLYLATEAKGYSP